MCVGYAFCTERLGWQPDPAVTATSLATAPDAPTVGRWAYGTYDCIPPHPGPRLAGVDLFVADGLNGRMRAENIAAIRAVSGPVSDALEQLDEHCLFWELPRAEIAEIPPEGTAAWHMWRAWSLMMGSKSVGIAIAHKTLHHKKPSVFPLIDNLTLPSLEISGAGTAWAQIHSDLTSQADAWSYLEAEFAAVAGSRGDVPLQRLRLHDILLWTRCDEHFDDAREEGESIIAAS